MCWFSHSSVISVPGHPSLYKETPRASEPLVQPARWGGSDLLEEGLPASLTVERGGWTWMQRSFVMGRLRRARLVGAGREPAGPGGGSAHHAPAVFASWGGLCEGCCGGALVGARLWTDGRALARGGEGQGRSASGFEGRPSEPGVRLSSLCEVYLLPQFLEKVLVRGSDGLSETDASPHTENRVSAF